MGFLGRGQPAPPHQLAPAAEGFSCILCRQIAFPSISVRVTYSLVLGFSSGDIHINIPHINSWGVSSPAYPPASDGRALGAPYLRPHGLPRATKFGMIDNTRGKELVLSRSAPPPSQGTGSQRLKKNSGTSYMRAQSMRNSNQFLHSDQTICGKIIYRVENSWR